MNKVEKTVLLGLVFTIPIGMIYLSVYATYDKPKIEYLSYASYHSDGSGGIGIGHGCIVVINGMIFDNTYQKKITVEKFIEEFLSSYKNGNYTVDYNYYLSDEDGLYC